MGPRKVIITCEHAGNYMPKSYELLFLGHEEILNSHRGWDIGALKLAKYLSKHLSAPLFYHKVSRLVVDINRSIGHDKLFSTFTVKLDEKVKSSIITKYYRPYRVEVEHAIERSIASGNSVVHLSIHSFTPILNGIERMVDVGILYDDNRSEEYAFADIWSPLLKKMLPNKVIMHNCPYHGADDGFTTYLRTKFSDDQYLGIELEVNQKYEATEDMQELKKALTDSLNMLCGMATI